MSDSKIKNNLLVAGLIVGLVFRAIKLPLPAPPVLAGIVGIVGIYLGGIGFDWLAANIFNK